MYLLLFLKRVENTLNIRMNIILLHDLSSNSKSTILHKLHHYRKEKAFFHKEKWLLN